MKESIKEFDELSNNSEISHNTDLKVFKSKSQNKHATQILKLSTDTKNNSTVQSTLKSEGEKPDLLSLYLKEEKSENKRVLNKKIDSKSELQKGVVNFEEEIEPYSMINEKVEEFPLSFRPTGLAIRDSCKNLQR